MSIKIKGKSKGFASRHCKWKMVTKFWKPCLLFRKTAAENYRPCSESAAPHRDWEFPGLDQVQCPEKCAVDQPLLVITPYSAFPEPLVLSSSM